MTAKTTSVLYFCYILLHDFWFLHDLELTNLCLMFFDQNDLCLTFKFKMVTANTHIKAVFMHVNYNVINSICLVSMRYAYSLIGDDRAKYPHHIAGFLLPCIKWYLDHQVAGGRGRPRILGRSAFWFVSRNRRTRYKLTNQDRGW